jgi:kumamolisin
MLGKQTDIIGWNQSSRAYGGGATGGGVSAASALPDYQQDLPGLQTGNPVQPGRGIPDVAGLADSQTAYVVRVNGANTVIGGTSAVAPLWSALIARINQALGVPAGYLNPLLYQQLSQVPVTWDINSGNNGLFEAATGWDACTGWGTPNGTALLAALSQG